jgi:hypothetical protein
VKKERDETVVRENACACARVCASVREAIKKGWGGRGGGGGKSERPRDNVN